MIEVTLYDGIQNPIRSYTDRLIERLCAKVACVDDRDSCWDWLGSCSGNGAGQINVHYRVRIVYRVVWELVNGPILDGLFVCHTCDRRICVRPSHLWLGTQLDNIRDCKAKGRMKLPDKSCAPRGDAHWARRMPERWAKVMSGSHVTGERHSMTHLTEENVKELRSLRSSGVKLHVLADKFGITQSAVSAIATGRSWRFLTP